MSDSDVHPRPATTRCRFAWCTTLHGSTVHPDDEAHRSAGIGFSTRVRGVDERGRGRDADVEVGVLRHPNDVDDWIVIEVAGGGIALSPRGAAELRRILTEDPGIAETFPPEPRRRHRPRPVLHPCPRRSGPHRGARARRAGTVNWRSGRVPRTILEGGAVISTTPTRVLIVCTANAIRSPFLEHLLRARLSETDLVPPVIGSAGSAARPGRAAEPRVVEIGRAHGLDLDTHRTRRLDEHLLASSVTVLCAAATHRRTVLDMRPDLLDSTFTVREFARLLSEQTDPVRGRGDWSALARAAARQRSRPRRGARGDDDLVDPIAQSAEVWDAFERDAVAAVDGIVRHAVRLLRPKVAALRTDPPPQTRREWRAARALLDSSQTQR